MDIVTKARQKWVRCMCEAAAAWDLFCSHPTDATWRNYIDASSQERKAYKAYKAYKAWLQACSQIRNRQCQIG